MATLTIDNFGGRLTRQNFGNINSGLANYDTSFGYNPFFNPGQLSWFKAPSDLTSTLSNGLALASVQRIESGTLATYIITSTGHLYRLIGDGSAGSDIRTLVTGSPTFTYGADITFYGAANTLFISHDLGVTKIVIDASGNFVSEAQVGTWDATHFTPITTRRAMHEFIGKLYVINGDASVTYANNIAEIDSTLTVTSYAKLAPSLPAGTYIRDLDISQDLTYLLISSSIIPSELIAPVNDTGNAAAGSSDLFKWNGTDAGITTGTSLPNFSVTALQSFSGKEMMFMYDTFGAALFESGSKKLTLRNQKSPMPGATCSAGNFVCWMNPDFYWNEDTQAGTINGSLYYYGQFDETSPVGLYRLFRQSSAIGGVIYTMPLNQFSANRYISVNTSAVIQVDSNGTHFYSFIDYSGSGGSTNNKFYSFLASPPDDSPGGWTGAMSGVYQTQTQMFPKKVEVKQVRVYTSDTVSNNSFTLDLIGSNGTKIANGSFSYTWTAGSDVTKLQGSLDRINFNAAAAQNYGIGIRITNAGSQNMTINKVELDYEPAGK